MSYDINTAAGTESLSALDRSVVRSLESIEFARQGARVMRYVAVAVVVCAAIGQYLILADDEFADLGTGRKVGSFLSGIATPFAIAGLIAAASFVVTAYVAGLEMHSVTNDALADDDTGGISVSGPLPAEG